MMPLSPQVLPSNPGGHRKTSTVAIRAGGISDPWLKSPARFSVIQSLNLILSRENIAANVGKVNSLHTTNLSLSGHVSIDSPISPCAAADLKILLWHGGEKAHIMQRYQTGDVNHTSSRTTRCPHTMPFGPCESDGHGRRVLHDHIVPQYDTRQLPCSPRPAKALYR